MKEYRSCDPELFRKVKESATMRQVAEYYGLRVNGRGLCLCPFHNDNRPSLKIYPNGKGFYCFSCGVGGDQIKFAALYRGISNAEAAKELAEAFGIPMQEPVTYREKREAELARRRRAAVADFAKKAKMFLMAYYGLICEAVRTRNGHFYEGIQNISWTVYMMEQIEKNPAEVYKDQKAVSKIGEIEGRVNNWYFEPGAGRTVSGRDILSDF